MTIRSTSNSTSRSDPALVLPGVWTARFEKRQWRRGREPREWIILTPRAKLEEKYTKGTSAIFTHYVYGFQHSEIHRITDVDIEAAHRLMGARIRGVRWRGITDLRRQKRLAEVLKEIPVKASIKSHRYDGFVNDAVKILTEVDGVQLSIATKLLCIKRPYLIPMMDSVVQYCFRSSEVCVILKGFRRILKEPNLSKRVSELADDIGAVIDVTPSPVRILDELIWFDWNLRRPNRQGWCQVVGFDDWGYDVKNDAHGVYYCPATERSRRSSR